MYTRYKILNDMMRIIHNLKVDLYRYLMFKRRWAQTPLRFLWASVDRFGITFFYKGDDVLWTWPWRGEVSRRLPFISIGFSGTGEFGDARFKSLAELDAAWAVFFRDG